MKILVSCPRGRTFNTFFDSENINYISELGEVIWNNSGKNFTANETKHLLCECDIYIMYLGAPMLDVELLDSAKRLKAVIYLGTNADARISKEVIKRGIAVFSGDNFYSASAAEGTLSYIFAALRKIPEYSIRIKYRNEWKHSWDYPQSLLGKTVGIINYNSVSEKLVQMLSAFNVRLLMYDRHGFPAERLRQYGVRPCCEREIFSRSDVISVHSSMHSDCYHMVGFPQLMCMKDNSIIVDTSTGGIVSLDALGAVLQKRSIFAILDVYENEPPEFDRELFYIDNLILMPHMAGATSDIRKHITSVLVHECIEYLTHSTVSKHRVYF